MKYQMPAENTLVISSQTPIERTYGIAAIAATGALTRRPRSSMVASGPISSAILSWRDKIGFATASSNFLYTSDAEYLRVY